MRDRIQRIKAMSDPVNQFRSASELLGELDQLTALVAELRRTARLKVVSGGVPPIERPAIETAVTSWLRCHDGDTFRPNQVLKGLSRSAVPNSAALNEFLQLLEGERVISPVARVGDHARGAGRPPGVEYHINRAALAERVGA